MIMLSEAEGICMPESGVMNEVLKSVWEAFKIVLYLFILEGM